MNRVSKFLSIAAATAAMTGVAFAEDPTPDDAGGAAGAGAAAGGTATVGTDGAKVDASATVGIFTAATWPKAYVDRPQNAAKGMIEITPTFSFYRVTSTDAMGNSTSDNSSAINVAARYGVNDKIELLAAFGGSSINGGTIPEHGIIVTGLKDGEPGGDRFKGDIKIGAGIVVAKGKLDLEVKAAFFDDLLFKNAAILAGADVRYHVTPKIWIGTPQNRTGLTLGVKNLEFGGMEVPGTKPLRLSIPAAVAFQATPDLAIQANTRLLDINLNDDAKGGPMGDSATFFGQDAFGGIPLDVDVTFALSNTMDVVGNLNLVNLKKTGDFLVISGGINIRM